MQDHARQIRAKLIADTPPDTQLDIKRRQAIAYLGENHVLHSNYTINPRHAFSVAGWLPHSTLRPVQISAQLAGRI